VERRKHLESAIKSERQCFLTPQTDDPKTAAEWFEQFEGAGLDGVIAKENTLLYHSGERVMFKIKHERTADCVVGGYRLSKQGDSVGSLLLGLYDSKGVLHFAGHTSAFKTSDRIEVLAKLKPLEGSSFGAGFGGGRTPGGPSRWNQGRDLSWIEVKPEIVCEVAFDHMQGDRFRHGTRIVRWRPDKDPRECTYDQLEPPKPFSLDDIRKLSESS
ncbi:MAG: ATP-dependent DNA ligase, partial [Acidimicrobiia bacterium]